MDLENENRIVTTSEMNGDSEIEYSLRPKRLAEYIGQKKAKENLKIYSRRQKSAATRSTTFCCTALPVWGRQRLPE